MTRTSFMLSGELRAKAKTAARKAGMSLGQFIRDSIDKNIRAARNSGEDPLFHLDISERPAPKDGSLNHDKYIYTSRKRR